MKNSLVLLAVVLSVAAFAGMMRIKTDVQTMDRERMRLVRERAELRETKRVLEAEWALLASPDRLGRLVKGQNYVAASALDIVPLQGPAVAVSPVVAVSASVVISLTTPTTPTAVVSETAGSAIEAVEKLMNQASEAVSETSAPDDGTEVMPGSATERD